MRPEVEVIIKSLEPVGEWQSYQESANLGRTDHWWWDAAVKMQSEIAQLRTALDDSVAREAIHVEYEDLLNAEINSLTPIAYVHGWRSTRVEEGKKLRKLLANPNPSAKSLLRDRERLEWIFSTLNDDEIRDRLLVVSHEHAYGAHRGIHLGDWRCSIDAAMTAKPATPDVVAERGGSRWTLEPKS